MSFTTNFFLFCLFPIFVAVYYAFRNNPLVRKILIILANAVFYIYGGIQAYIVLCVICLMTWIFIGLVRKTQSKKVFAFGCILILMPLIFCKYTDFLFQNLSQMLSIEIYTPILLVPVGLSFYTFEAISLLADIFTDEPATGSFLPVGKKVNTDHRLSFVDVFLYLTFFPTVISGPIVRHEDFVKGYSKQLTTESFNQGIERFAIGLCKKALIADKLAVLADYYFDAVSAGNALSSTGLWLGSFAYSLQLYFDFSGYSDMAIGTASLLGFDLPENFNSPYLASSVQDFWRRWHISLSNWFRDYVYIPLGGNRCSTDRHILNLLVVWSLTGIWHGADWTFLIWGLGYFILLIAEKYWKILKNIGKHWYGHIYTLFFVNLLWIPFRADSIHTSNAYIHGMFSFNTGIERKAVDFIPLLFIAIIACLPWKSWFVRFEKNAVYQLLRSAFFLVITALAVCAVLNSTYSPYIYGTF